MIHTTIPSARASTPLPASPTRGEVLLGVQGTTLPREPADTLPLRGEGWGGGRRLLGAILLLLTVLLAVPAFAEETINSFTSNIILEASGTVDVTEIIEVNAEGNQIRRGIFRDIFTTMINDDNSRLRSDLTVVSVQRDGHAEPYAMESVSPTIQRIRIGDADVFLDYGPHRYTIHYRMTRMGRFFDDHDELYWNATGNFWDFPILRSVTTIKLPDGAVIKDLVGYTGRVGSNEQAVAITKTSPNTATFRTNRALASGEGVTVAASFQKGILAEPSDLDKVLNWISDHRDLVFPGLAVFLVLAYNLFAWGAVGRDPEKGTIIPLFHAPKGFSPGLVHYINNMGWKNTGWTAFTASIFNLGVRGLVSIDNVGKALKVSVTNKADAAADLPAGEKLIFDYIRSKTALIVNTTNGPALNTKREEFIKSIESENREGYFRNNYGYVLLGVALSVVLLGLLIAFGVMDAIYLFVAVIGGIAIGVFSALFSKFWARNIMGKIIIAIWVIIGGSNLFGIGLDALAGIRVDTGLISALSIVVINVIFAVLMRAPTVQGRKIMDQIDGFKMYLETAEKNRLNFAGAPPMTVTRFEAILPFAIALGVEKPWAEHFEGELSRHAVADFDGTGTYHPSWYTGSDWNSSSGISNTVASVSSGMSAAMVAAQPVSSSSSGFSSGGGGGGGGGGSSGGGGGGGGGGGW